MHDDKKVLAFVGMAGAGKSVCVSYLKERGLPCVYFGGITLDEIKQRGLEENEASEKLVREDIRAKEGKGAYAVRIIKQVEEMFEKGHEVVVADGLYSWTEYKIFKESFGDSAIIIAIMTPEKIRHKRLSSREIRPLNGTEAKSRDYAEIENLEKGGPIANADYYLANDENVQELEGSLQKLLEELNVKV